MENNDILTAQEVAAYLRMNTMTIYRMAQTGRIPASKVLDCWRFQRKEIERWLMERSISIHVLIVDSDQRFAEDALSVLSRAGVNCTLVTNSKEALKYLQERRFSWAFIGIALDDGSGLGFMQRIGEEYPEQRAVLMVDPGEWGFLEDYRGQMLMMEKVCHEEAWRQFIQVGLGSGVRNASVKC